MSTNKPGMTEELTVNIRIDPRTLLVPCENPLPNTVWHLVQVPREFSEWANLLEIMGRSGGHVGKDREVIIWVPTKRRL